MCNSPSGLAVNSTKSIIGAGSGPLKSGVL